jgi:hypothetical protein
MGKSGASSSASERVSLRLFHLSASNRRLKEATQTIPYLFKMAFTLDNIPSELFERIVEQLDTRDIFALRLGSRLLASKATQRTFKSLLRTKHVYLDERSLTRFVHATRSGGLGCLVENLVLVGLATDLEYLESLVRDHRLPTSAAAGFEVNANPSPEFIDSLRTRRDELRTFRNSQEDTRLLSEAFRNLSQSIAPRCLPSLSLQVRIYYLDGQRHETPGLHEKNTREDGFDYNARFDPIREAAVLTFHTTMESLMSSHLTIKKLDLYNSSEMHPCSLSTTEVNNIEARYPGLRECFDPMESLTMSLCNPESPRDEMPDESNSLGLGQLLVLLQKLSHLDVHYFIQGHFGHKRIFHPRALMQHAAACSDLPNLQSCRIGGLHCDTGDLLLFLQRTKPKCVALENVIALSESWRPVLDFLTDPQVNIKSLYLGHLFGLKTPIERLHLDEDNDFSVDTNHVWFDEPGTTTSGVSEAARRSTTVMRQNDAVKLPLDHFVGDDARNIPLIYNSYGNWSERKLWQYGSI